MHMALYQPDIPGNAGAMMRTAACLGVGVDIIGPCGFVLSDKQMRRAGMDYLDRLDWTDHVESDADFIRPTEIAASRGDYSKAKANLGWEPKTTFEELIQLMVDEDIRLLSEKA